MTNKEIALHFALLADLLEVQGENPFKIKSYTNAAETIAAWPAKLFGLDNDALYQIPGIGQAIGEKVRELQRIGHINALQKVSDSMPPGILDLLKVAGLSAKKIGMIWRALGINTIEEFELAAREKRIAPIKGFGAKTEEGIAEAIEFYKKNLGYFMWSKVDAMAAELLDALGTAFQDFHFYSTGALRRQEDVLNKLELLTDAPLESLKEWLQLNKGAEFVGSRPENYPPTAEILSFNPDGWPQLCICHCKKEDLVQAHFRTTGTPAFLAYFKDDSALANAASEEAIFENAALSFIPPPLRTNGEWIAKAANRSLPKLIVPEDIKGLIHCHSHYSDGGATLLQMATAARDKGLEYMVISDHSQAAQYAKGLYPDRVLLQHREIEQLNEQLAPFKIFKSIEADILSDGSLDYNDQVLSSFDLVITSVHSTLKMDEAKAMKRLLKAIANPYTTILGHMTGRLLLRRPGYPVDHKKIIEACAAHQVVIEINANPRRLDMDWTWIQNALECGVLLSINPDAHSIAGIDDLRYGVLAAQKGGLTAKNNLSSYSLAEFEAFLETSRYKR